MTINGVKECMFVFMLNWIKFAINTVKIIGLKIYFYIYIGDKIDQRKSPL